MASFRTQFHALPEELLSILLKWRAEPEVRIYTKVGSSEMGELASEHDIREAVLSSGVNGLNRVFLTLGDANLMASTVVDFLLLNPGTLTLEIGRITPEGLTQSNLMCGVKGPKTPALWNKFNRMLKAQTRAGVVVQSLVSKGDFGFDRNHRYTEGAERMAKQGVVNLGLGSGHVLRPDLEGQAPAK